MKKARAQEPPQPLRNKTSPAEGLRRDPQEAAQPTAPGWPKTAFKPDWAKLSGCRKLFTCKCWLSEGSRSNHRLTFALPRAGEGSHTIAKTHKVTVWLLLSLLRGFFRSASGLLLDACVFQWLSGAVFAFCLLKPPKQAGCREGLSTLAVPVNSHSPQLPFVWRGQSHTVRAIPSPPVQTWMWQLFQLQGRHISLPRGLVFLRGGGGACFGFGLGFSPPASSRCCCRGACLPRRPERRGSAACRHTCARPSYQPLQAGRAGRRPLLGFLFLIGTHPPEGHHISFITWSHLRDVCDKLSGFPPAFFKLSLPRQERPCGAPREACGSSQRLLQLAKNLQGCNELLTLSRYNLWQKESHQRYENSGLLKRASELW